MAIWQRDYFILPQSKLVQFCGTTQTSVSEDDLNERDWWGGVPEPDKRFLSRLLPPLKSSINGQKVWGSFMGNRFSLGYGKNGSLTDVQLRIDLSREPQKIRDFVAAIVEMSQKSGWAFLPMVSDSVLMPEYDVIVDNLNLEDT